MKKKFFTLLGGVILTFSLATNLSAQGTWEAPAAPGVNIDNLDESTTVFLYNIETGAIFSKGMDYNTKAIADAPEGKDSAEPALRQKLTVKKDGNNIKIHYNGIGDNQFFGQGNDNNAGSMWSDLNENSGNRILFTPTASTEYPNAYTLTNVDRDLKVDVLWDWGGKLTLYDGKGYYDWAFLTASAFTGGEVSKFKARKAIWDYYKALRKAGAVSKVASALSAANDVYTNASATTDQLRTAFRTLFLATAPYVTDPVDVSYLFSHPDISSDGSASNWSYTDFKWGAGECEKFHGSFTSSQSVSDAPKGIYDVIFNGIWRQDVYEGDDAPAAPQLIVNNGTDRAVDFPNMNDLVDYWSVTGTHNADDWRGVDTEGGSPKRPWQMWSCADALAHSAASAKVENLTVDGTLSITFKVTTGTQWFNFQRVRIIYKGGVNLSTYKTLLDRMSDAQNWVTENTGVLDQRYLDAVTSVISSHDARTGNSSVDNLNNAIKEIASMRGASQKINALRMPDVYTGSAPAAGNVYLYNIGTGMFLGSGSDWNTHAAVDQVGIEITLVEDNGNYKMQTDFGWLNYGAYVDTGYQDVWHFVPVEGKINVYNISSTGNDAYLLGYDPNGPTDGKKYWSTISKDRSGFNDPWNQWKIITADERETLIASASLSNPVDVSYLINNPSLNKKPNLDMYTKTNTGGNATRVSTVTDNNGERAADFGYELWNNTFSFTQTINGLPEGVYMVSVQAFYRDGSGNNQATQVNNRNVLGRLAYLEANGNQTLLPNIASVVDLAQGMEPGDMKTCNNGEFPNYPNAALEYFQRGAYVTTVVTKVGADHQLTFGVKKDSNNNEDWVVLDNFRLTYLGNDESIDYMPLPVKTGFNVDVVAENDDPDIEDYISGDNRLGLDYVGSLLYTQSVLQDGGLPDDGEITTLNGNKYYIDYTKLNALKIRGNNAHKLELSDHPNAKALYVMGISSDGASTVDIVANYTDNTSSGPATLSMKDWVYGDAPNVALNNIKRSAYYYDNVNEVSYRDFDQRIFYPYEVKLNTDPSKTIESITLTRTSSGDGASTILAVSMYGKITKNITLNDGYATFSAAQAYRIDTDGVKAYKMVNPSANSVRMVALDGGIPANTGVVLFGKEKSRVELTAVSESTSDVSENLMKPNVSDYQLPGSEVIGGTTYYNYTLGRYDNKIMFLRSSGQGTLAAGKAYLQLPASSNARISLTFDDETTTGITNNNRETITNNRYYDLQGRRVNKPTKGIFLLNGKKVVK